MISPFIFCFYNYFNDFIFFDINYNRKFLGQKRTKSKNKKQHPTFRSYLRNILDVAFYLLYTLIGGYIASSTCCATLSPLIDATIDNAKRKAAAGPFAVMTLPSTSTVAAVKSAPCNADSNPG